MEVKEFNRSNAREISNRIQEVLDNLSDELGLTLKMDGGRFSDDKLTLKVEVTIQNEDGGRMISDQTNGRADREAKSEGISFKAPHFIGSIWNLSGRAGLCKVVDYKSKNRSYPFIVEAYESGKRFKAGSSSFRMGKELVPPTDIEFMKWFTGYSYVTKNAFDDSVDSLAIFADKFILGKTKTAKAIVLNMRH